MSSLSQGQRLLAAIMITDAVGFSKRMSVDEGLTLNLIDRDLTLIAETCSDYGGTVLKSTGDGLLIYFVSAVEAVTCGLDIQQKLVALATDLPTDQSLDHRIGIHLGDILVSEQDVMGNGVNITARLQTYAKPRGLCVSQTIYDVVKARLSLNSTFLGPLQLKNIQEAVPAYQISLESEGADPDPSVADDSTCTLPMSTEVLLDIAVRTLITHSHSRRLKKLVFAAYQQAWENDSAVLGQFDLRSLLTCLRERYPTLNELEYQFQRIVLGLNHQSIYHDVTATILETLQPWYSRSIVSQPGVPAAAASHKLLQPSPAEQYQQVAERLSQDEAAGLRIRKVLYCLCNHCWENDPAVLYQTDLPTLIEQSLQIAPQPKDLRYHLGRIVKRLNRRQVYTRLANEVMAAFQVFYNSQAEATQLSGGSGELGESPSSANGRSGARGQVLPEETCLTSPPDGDDDSGPSQTIDTCLGLSASRDNNGDLTTLHGALSNPLERDSSILATPLVDPHPQRSRESLFDLRIEILQYTNPLRAKILLHSCLHGPFSYTSQDWYSLRQQTLDDLLQQTFNYCPTFSDLDSKLMIIAHCLDPNEENVQVASTITRAMKAYYPRDPDAPLDKLDLVPSPLSPLVQATTQVSTKSATNPVVTTASGW